MFNLEHSLTVHAEPERIWEVLIDFDSYPEWNPYLQKVSGVLEVKSKLRIEMHLKTGHPYEAKPRILEIDPAKKLVFRSRLYFPGFYDVFHYFELEPKTAHRTVVTYTQHWRGKVAKGLFKKMGADTEEAMLAMLKALKKAV